MHDELTQRADEISRFLGVSFDDAVERLQRGFHHNHAEVAADFKAFNPQNDDDLLKWYMSTEAYIWELSAYHLDAGFNYSGFCAGVVEKISNSGSAAAALVLGDGIGDMSMALTRAAIPTYYHDLRGSKTAEFAEVRHRHEFGFFLPAWTKGWEADFEWTTGLGENVFQAIVAADFMEHLPEPQVEKWATAVAAALIPGGLFGAQNAFNIGSGSDGSIPCHVAESDHYEQDWNPLMESLGFEQVGDIWYQKGFT